jgi:hypothetical protein
VLAQRIILTSSQKQSLDVEQYLGFFVLVKIKNSNIISRELVWLQPTVTCMEEARVRENQTLS